MIVVDTSVWVEANRRPEREVARTLEALIDADEVGVAFPVRLEVLGGIAKADRRAFCRGFSGLPLLVPTEDTLQPLDDWIVRAAAAGHRFAFTDLLIAALAQEAGALVWSLDTDFERMAECGFVRLH